MMQALGGEEARTIASTMWWTKWFEADFSWTGLRSKPTPSAANHATNLQDWWATDASGQRRTDTEMEQRGELIRDPDGELWHIVHTPFAWRDGTPTLKSEWVATDWDRFNEVVSLKQKRSGVTDADIHGSVFGQDQRAQFEGGVFDRLPVRLSGDPQGLNGKFEHCYFRKEIRTKSLCFGAGTSFEGSLFQENVRFDRCRALGALSFDRAVFIRHVSFASAQFQDDVSFEHCRFLGGVLFESAEFLCWTHFDRSKFLTADFPQTRFAANAMFQNCEFGSLEFGDARFERQVSFDGADLSAAADASFWNATFEGDADFDRVRWPRLTNLHAAVFRNAHFRSMASFRSENFHQFALFEGARFDGLLVLPRKSAFSRSAFAVAVQCAREDASSGNPSAQSFDHRMHQLENAFRCLKTAAEKQRDRALELRLHQLELTTRRMQSTTPLLERSVSYAYDAVSGYGNSVGSPILTLFLAWGLFGGAYFAWNSALVGSGNTSDLLEALRLSASAIFKPFDVWSRSSGAPVSWVTIFLDGFGSGHSLTSRVVVTAESIVALTLLFLIALALRRKFQVS